MLKAAGRTGDGQPLLVVGLSQKNVDDLLAAQPIVLDVAQLGLAPMKVLLLGAQDEGVIVSQLRSYGLIPPCCDAHAVSCVPGGLCCRQCPESTHPRHPLGVRCARLPPPETPPRWIKELGPGEAA